MTTTTSDAPKHVLRRVRIPINSEARLEKGTTLASLLTEREQLVAELAEIRLQYRQRLARIDARICTIRQDIGSATEERPVRCVEVPDYERGVVVVRRLDTNDVIDEREIEDDERQVAIPGTEEEEPG